MIPPPSQVDNSTIAQSAAGVLAVKAPNRAIDHYSTPVTSPARAAGTIYQNTGTTSRRVTIGFALAAARAQLLVDAATPPVAVAYDSGAGGITVQGLAASFEVGPGEYYELLKVSGTTLTVMSWQERQL